MARQAGEGRETPCLVHEGEEQLLEVQDILDNFPDAEGDYIMGSTLSMLEDCIPTLSLEADRTIIGSCEELREAMFFLMEVETPTIPMQEFGLLC